MDISKVRNIGYALITLSATLMYAGSETLAMGMVLLANLEFFIGLICFTNGATAIYMTNGL